MENCIFCKILKGEIPAEKVYEDINYFIIKDIDPKCKNHFLAIPKKHYAKLSDMENKDSKVLGEIFSKISSLEKELDLKNGFRLIINQGSDAGQSVQHLHIHILSGKKMGWTPA